MRRHEGSRARRTALRVGDLRFEARICGPDDGEVVLLLHGFPTEESMWDPVLQELGDAGWKAVAPRQRGYSAGARPAGRAAYSADQLLGDVFGFADALDAARFHLVGHDWGGVLGWVAAANEPGRVRSLCSLSTPHPAAMARAMLGGQALRSAYAAFFQLPLVPEVLLGAGHRAFLRMALERSGLPGSAARRYADALDADALHAALNWYRGANPAQLARTGPVRPPTLYIWGNGDQALGRAAAEATGGQALGPYRFVELDAPHWLVETHQREVVDLLGAHLDRHRRGSPRRGAHISP